MISILNNLFKKKKKKRAKGEEILSCSDLVPGDYVVHEAHGIGRFAGMQRINTGGSIKDYLKIIYRGDDVLYVPATQLDMVAKYIGGGEDQEAAAQRVLDWPGFTDLTAYKEGRYRHLDVSMYMYKPNSRFAEAYEQLAAFLYPDLFPEA